LPAKFKVQESEICLSLAIKNVLAEVLYPC
jgi:hypothetical protein